MRALFPARLASLASFGSPMIRAAQRHRSVAPLRCRASPLSSHGSLASIERAADRRLAAVEPMGASRVRRSPPSSLWEPRPWPPRSIAPCPSRSSEKAAHGSCRAPAMLALDRQGEPPTARRRALRHRSSGKRAHSPASSDRAKAVSASPIERRPSSAHCALRPVKQSSGGRQRLALWPLRRCRASGAAPDGCSPSSVRSPPYGRTPPSSRGSLAAVGPSALRPAADRASAPCRQRPLSSLAPLAPWTPAPAVEPEQRKLCRLI